MNSLQIFDSYAQKVSDESGVSYVDIVKLRDMGLLDEQAVRDLLIRHDFDALLKTKKLTDMQIYAKLSGDYELGIQQLQYIINKKRKKMYYCTCCGRPISRVKFARNEGQCDKCLSNNI